MGAISAKYNEFQELLAQIYQATDESFKARVSESKFVNAFPVLWQVDTALMVEKPDDFELSDETFSLVLDAFISVYR